MMMYSRVKLFNALWPSKLFSRKFGHKEGYLEKDDGGVGVLRKTDFF